MVLAERNRQIAALGDSDAVGERGRQIGEFFQHRRLRREVLLRREWAWSSRVGQDMSFGDADARLVCAKIGRPEELDRMRGNDR